MIPVWNIKKLILASLLFIVYKIISTTFSEEKYVKETFWSIILQPEVESTQPHGIMISVHKSILRIEMATFQNAQRISGTLKDSFYLLKWVFIHVRFLCFVIDRSMSFSLILLVSQEGDIYID